MGAKKEAFICLTCTLTVAHIHLLNESLARIMSCKASELIPSFMKWYPILLTFWYTQIGGGVVKQGLEAQIRAQSQINFKIGTFTLEVQKKKGT
jgi:hypothetical protein